MRGFTARGRRQTYYSRKRVVSSLILEISKDKRHGDGTTGTVDGAGCGTDSEEHARRDFIAAEIERGRDYADGTTSNGQTVRDV